MVIAMVIFVENEETLRQTGEVYPKGDGPWTSFVERQDLVGA
ncbi:MAG: hypothetical protein VX834_13520 [Myxococcota bacterium]|nr:hypothetical protein [Myxococcota bacterium]